MIFFLLHSYNLDTQTPDLLAQVPLRNRLGLLPGQAASLHQGGGGRTGPGAGGTGAQAPDQELGGLAGQNYLHV